jgi:hypothetical protein
MPSGLGRYIDKWLWRPLWDHLYARRVYAEQHSAAHGPGGALRKRTDRTAPAEYPLQAPMPDVARPREHYGRGIDLKPMDYRGKKKDA